MLRHVLRRAGTPPGLAFRPIWLVFRPLLMLSERRDTFVINEALRQHGCRLNQGVLELRSGGISDV